MAERTIPEQALVNREIDEAFTRAGAPIDQGAQLDSTATPRFSALAGASRSMCRGQIAPSRWMKGRTNSGRVGSEQGEVVTWFGTFRPPSFVLT